LLGLTEPSIPAPGPTSAGRTRSSAPGASPPPCPVPSPTRWCGGWGRPAPRIRSSTARRPSANSVTPGPLPRYLVSDRDMSVLGVGDTQT